MYVRKTIAALIVLVGITALVQGCGGSQDEPMQDVAFSADERGNSISVIDLRTGTVQTTPIVVSPHNVQASSDGRSLFVVGSPAGIGGGMADGMDGPGRLLGFDAAAVSRGSTFDIPVGREPAHVIVDTQGTRAFVTNAGDNAVSVIEIARRQTVKSIPVGESPHGLRMSPDGQTIYVANTGEGTVSVIDTTSQNVIATIVTGAGEHGVVVSNSGDRVLVANTFADTVSVIDPVNREVVANIRVGQGPGGITLIN